MDILAAIYETLFGLYNKSYDLIFSTLFNEGGYLKFVLSFVLIPLATWLLFYYVWKYPYGRWLHWGGWLIISFVLVFGITWGIANTEIFASNNEDLKNALNDTSTGYQSYASTLPSKYALYNGILTIFLGVFYSLILKQFSKIQTHLPF